MYKILSSELDSILEGTSRSFYLSLKQLPSKIRTQISLLYLLARTSDTIADSEHGSTEFLTSSLDHFEDFVLGSSTEVPNLSNLAELQSNPFEGELLENVEEVKSFIGKLTQSDQNHLRKCLEIIIGGQKLDLLRFSSEEEISCILSTEQLDDYTFRVAGSVGEFWTHISLNHLFKAEKEEEKILLEKGIRFGKALQMINILRDIPSDLRNGRCYIPLDMLSSHGLNQYDLMNPENMSRFNPIFNQLMDVTESHLDEATQYIDLLPHRQFRLRGSCMLPIVIGRQTLTMLGEGNVLESTNRIKISRSDIEQAVRSVVLAVPFQNKSRRLIENDKSGN